MKTVLRLTLCVALLLIVFLAVPRKAHADLTCTDCIRLCFLSECGFFSDPACEAAVYDSCYAGCSDYCQ
jgi:hypothetical protein